MKPPVPEECAAFVGLDWADAKPDVCIQAAGSARREFLVLEHRPEAIDAWVCTLRTRFNGQPVAVGLARNQGPIVSALRQYDCLVLFPVNPLTLAQYRDAFTPSRAKDDPTDAERQVELLLKHRDKRTPLTPQSPTMRALAQLVEHRRRLVGDTVRLTHRRTRALKNSFPHVLQWFDEKDTAIFCDVLNRWPTRKAAPLARRSTLERFFRDHHVRSADRIATRLQAIKSAIALTTDAGILTPNALLGHALVAQLRVTLQAIADFDKAIAQRAQCHPDFALFDALPGAGAVCAPRLLVAFGEQRERYTSADDLQKYAGIAPVTERRGKNAWCTGGSSVQSSCDKRVWSGRRNRSDMPSGHVCSPSSNATRARHTKPPCARWRASGAACFFGVGRSARRITSPSLSMRSTAGGHP